MSKLPTLIAAVLLPVLAHADPTPSADETKTCADERICVAEMFADAMSLTAAVPAVHLDGFITFEQGSTRVYSQSREKLQALAASWRKHARWSMITVGAHAGGSHNLALAQQRADKIRGYLLRYGVAAEYVVAIGYGDERGDLPAVVGAGSADLTVDLCDPASKDCSAKKQSHTPVAQQTP